MNLLFKVYNWIQWHLLGGRRRAVAFARQRFANQQHRYDYPPENNGWKKMYDSPIYGNEETGTIFDPQVIEHEGLLLMSVSERKTGSIILLRSYDTTHWEKECTLLTPRKNSWEHIVNRSCLRYIEGKWHLWYTGQCNDRSAIGHLVSESYMHFDLPFRSKPVLRPSMPMEGESVMNPCVLWNECHKKFQMWYAAGESYEPDCLFYAESSDGDIWIKHPAPVLMKKPSHPWEQRKVGGCDVTLLPDGTYEMYYIGYQNVDVARICYATSTDGIHWHRKDNNYCISPSQGVWDSDAVYKPSYITYNGNKYMWYNGRSGNQEYIGIAQFSNNMIC